MGVKSTRSAGTVHTPKGPIQGQSLIDPDSGNPYSTVVDADNKRRLAVDANFTAQNVQAEVNLDSDEDEVAVEDPDTGAHIRVELDGSINANVEVDAADGDNIAIKDVTGTNAAAVDSDNNLHVELHGNQPSGLDATFRTSGIDSGNSTSTPLGASSTFTGTYFDAAGYSNLTVLIAVDQDSAVDGFIVDHSSDGVNVDDSDAFTISSAATPGGNKQFSFPLPGRYYRIRYTNGTVAQGSFRLQAKLHAVRPKPSSHKLGDLVSKENDAELVKVVPTIPSEIRERTPIHAVLENATINATGTVVHTVTAGKTFFMTSYVISILNNSVSVIGRAIIRDGTINKFPYLVPPKSGSTPSEVSTNSPALPEPGRFTTEVRLIAPAGNILASIAVIGYEE